jgi:non-canonical poly(A) RNA polymerase PAPD5/7
MGDTYRPARRDRDPPPPRPLADRITFGNGGGDNYRPGGQNKSEFTFQSNHPAPRFPPSGPANGNSRGPPRNNRGGGRGGRRGDHHGRNNANGFRRGGARHKAAPHERALLLHQDDGEEQMYGVSNGPNRFMNIDDMSDHDEADMDESDASANDDAAEGQDGKHKVARTQAPRADGDSEPKFAPRWSNPDPYTALPPPSETTGVKKDVVNLIRKAKNQAAEKAIGNNAVAANDDFISFGDDLAENDDDAEDGEVDEDPGLQIYEDNEPIRSRAEGKASQRPVQGSVNDLDYGGNAVNETRRDVYDSYQPMQASAGKKRKAGRDVAIVADWLSHSRSGNPTPWATNAQTYQHLFKKPDKW